MEKVKPEFDLGQNHKGMIRIRWFGLVQKNTPRYRAGSAARRIPIATSPKQIKLIKGIHMLWGENTPQKWKKWKKEKNDQH